MTSQTDRINGLTGSVAIKVPCKAATTANITLSGEQTIDGVSVTDGMRVLVKDQNDTEDNGIYLCDKDTWVRAKDFNGTRDIAQGTLVRVISGTIHALSNFEVTTADPVINTTALEFGVIAVTEVSAVNVPVVDAGDYFTGDEVETALQEVGADIELLQDRDIGGYDRGTHYFAEMLGYDGDDETSVLWNNVGINDASASMTHESTTHKCLMIYGGDDVGDMIWGQMKTAGSSVSMRSELGGHDWDTEKRRLMFTFRNPALESQYLFVGFGDFTLGGWTSGAGHIDEHCMAVLGFDDEAWFSTGTGAAAEVTDISSYITDGENALNNNVEIIFDGPAGKAYCYVNGTLRATHTDVPTGTAEANYLWQTSARSIASSAVNPSYAHSISHLKVDVEGGLS